MTSLVGPTLVLAPLLAATLPAFAQPGGERRGPPPEAIAACAELVENDACSIVRDDTAIDGTCHAGPRPDLPLACRPDRAADRPQRRRGPPAEAVEACAALEASSVCVFVHRDEERTGTCEPGPRDETLACRPDRARR
ncbi:MAG: hypothetical protein KTR31_07345 [Myxococcales bacterium]|nr:hypothetical protein [Myxococcales bacterium]